VPSTVTQITAENCNYGRIQCVKFTKKVHDQCPCLIPFKFHTIPTGKYCQKKVYVCSEHFLDGMPTQRNPFPKLKLGYERKVTPGRSKL
jgi:hypothetical protein